MANRLEDLRGQLVQLQDQLTGNTRRNRAPGSFAAGLILGLVVGAALALFFSPQSGEHTREQVREAGIELKDRAVSQAQDTLGQVKERAQTLTDTAKDQVQSISTRLGNRAEEVADAAQQTEA